MEGNEEEKGKTSEDKTDVAKEKVDAEEVKHESEEVNQDVKLDAEDKGEVKQEVCIYSLFVIGLVACHQ